MESYLEPSNQTRGLLYTEAGKYAPTPFEEKAEFLLMHHSDGAITEVLHTNPTEPKTDYVLVMVPGFITILDSWEIFLQGVKDGIEIYYWESREKGTFHPPPGKLKRESFLPERYTLDLIEFIKSLSVPQDRIILAGSSFGGTLIIDALSQEMLTPKIAILIGANIHFHLPFIGNILAKIVPAGLMNLLKPAMRWYLRNFEVDRSSDEAQYQKYVKAIELANFSYIKHTVRNYHRHPQEELLSQIKVFTIVVGARLDKMHTIEESKFTTGEIPNSELVAFETNKETHSEPFVEYFMKRFFTSD